MEDVKDFLVICVAIVIGFVGLVVTICALVLLFCLVISPIASHSCHVYGGETGRQVKYTTWGDRCFVKMPNGWFTKDQISQNSVDRDR